MKLPNFLYIRLMRRRNPTCSIHRRSVVKNISMQDHCGITEGAMVYDTSMGRYTYINNYAQVTRTTIGSFTSIGPHCVIGLGGHPSRDYVSTSPALCYKGAFLPESIYHEDLHTVIGNDVWVGANVTIVPGVKIGDGAIIGANALVNKDVEPYQVVGGVPARLIRMRFAQGDIDWLLAVKWWAQDDEWLKEHGKDFCSVLSLRESCGDSIFNK